MRKIAVLFSLLFVSSLVFAQQKLPEGAMSGDFKVSQECVLLRASCPTPKFVQPVEIWATSTLINRFGEGRLASFAGSALRGFFIQTGVFSVSDGTIHKVFQDGEADSARLAKSIPRKKDTLVIFLSHKRFSVGGDEATYGVARGAGWFAVWIDPFNSQADAERQILHELGHQFGLNDGENESSVMCSPANGGTCSEKSFYFSGSELGRISSVIRIMKRISFDTYTRLKWGNDSYEVYSITHEVKYEDTAVK